LQRIKWASRPDVGHDDDGRGAASAVPNSRADCFSLEPPGREGGGGRGKVIERESEAASWERSCILGSDTKRDRLRKLAGYQKIRKLDPRLILGGRTETTRGDFKRSKRRISRIAR